MKKGTRKVTIWTGFEFDLIGTDISYILGLYKASAKLIPKPVETANGQTIRPGDVVLRLGGKKTSAGFSTIWFDDENNGADGKGLVYEGCLAGLDGEYLCFTELRDFKKVKHVWKNYKEMYYAFIESGLPGNRWLFTNQACSGRVTETTNVILRREPHYDRELI
jgi:hypothetical protein